jgi:hypothetical protein
VESSTLTSALTFTEEMLVVSMVPRLASRFAQCFTTWTVAAVLLVVVPIQKTAASILAPYTNARTGVVAPKHTIAALHVARVVAGLGTAVFVTTPLTTCLKPSSPKSQLVKAQRTTQLEKLSPGILLASASKTALTQAVMLPNVQWTKVLKITVITMTTLEHAS